MSVVRIDLDKCIGCKMCVEVCSMDVFYYTDEAKKSVIAYPENCQNCGQCFFYCPTGSIGISNESFGFPVTAFRGTTTAALNHYVVTDPGTVHRIMEGEPI